MLKALFQRLVSNLWNVQVLRTLRLVWMFLFKSKLNCLSLKAGLCSGSKDNYLGEPADPLYPGTYYLKTNSQTPFALG